MKRFRQLLPNRARLIPLRGARAARVALFALAAGIACATGVDVSDEEFQTICAEDPSLDCAGTGTAQGGSGVGNGGSLNPPINNQGGSGSLANNGGGGASNVGTGGSGNTVTGGTGGTTGNAGTGPIMGGSCTSIVAPIGTGVCAQNGTATVTYSDRTEGIPGNQASMELSLAATSALNLPDVVIRYWFTANGLTDFTGEFDYASLGDGSDLRPSMCSAFGSQLGSEFADIAFTGGGSITSIQTIQLRVHTTGYAPMEQTDDFSFVSDANAAANPRISVYADGQLVGGCEPGSTPP